ncbi:thioredoxin family protein [Actinomadura luteofluorescens]|uniref:Thiol-disulfide isomerase/thioredoxin n=2 Tax=Thermomonosporaceae TaxID=2012 RepID=A0A7Y9JG86_9ACTN|nr:Thiol-disulfide isomerase or thioredoxin [Actinomadura glauciflava]NYD47301.1 thiol-disulfide isomerase/thioredoxin [Actinomadura luteofluorescens]
MIGALTAAGVLLAATAFGLVRRRRDGVLRARREEGEQVGETVGPDDMGAELGEKATLLQFSSAFCAPCRATRRVLGEVSQMVEGVAHVELDAEAHLDLVRRLNVVRTPTVLVLDAAGRVVRRAAGAPRKPDVIAALGEAIT